MLSIKQQPMKEFYWHGRKNMVYNGVTNVDSPLGYSLCL